METETIDKLFLELSQVTNAYTALEIELFGALQEVAELKYLSERLEQPAGLATAAWMKEQREYLSIRTPSAWANVAKLLSRRRKKLSNQ